MLQGHDQRRAQDGRALRHPVLRRLVLRHPGFQRFAARDRPAADRARRARRTDGADRSGDRPRRGEGLGGDRALQAALYRQEGLADHRRRQVVVGGGRAAGGRPRTGRHQRQEIHQGGQGAHQGADGPGCPHDRRYDAARNVQDAEGRQGRHHALGRQVAVRRPEGRDALARHQPGAQPRLYGLCRHGEAGRGNRQGAVQSDVGAAPPAGAVGERREELAGQGDRADGRRSRRAGRRSGGRGESPPRQEDLQLQDGRSRHHRGCDPGACADHGRGVRQHTNASGGCGVCADRLEDILAALPAAAAPTACIAAQAAE